MAIGSHDGCTFLQLWKTIDHKLHYMHFIGNSITMASVHEPWIYRGRYSSHCHDWKGYQVQQTGRARQPDLSFQKIEEDLCLDCRWRHPISQGPHLSHFEVRRQQSPSVPSQSFHWETSTWRCAPWKTSLGRSVLRVGSRCSPSCPWRPSTRRAALRAELWSSGCLKDTRSECRRCCTWPSSGRRSECTW